MQVFARTPTPCPDVIGRQFDFFILSDLVNDVWDVQTVLTAKALLHIIRLVIRFYNRLWEFPLKRLRKPCIWLRRC